MHGGKVHQIHMARIANEYRQRGYSVTIAGERARNLKLRGLPRVDIIAEKNNTVDLVECGWLSNLYKIAEIRKAIKQSKYLKDKQVRVVWHPRLIVMEQQKSALKR